MKSLAFSSFLLLLLTIIINTVAGAKCKVKNVSSNGDVTKTKEKYYLIYVNNTAGEFKVFGEPERIKKRQEILAEQFVFTMVDEIHDLIIENKDTYKNQKKFEKLEEKTKLRKRDIENIENINNGDNGFIKVISSVDNVSVLYGYFSEEVAEKVSKIENVIACEPDTQSAKYHASKYYNTKDIKKETKWKGVGVREKADFHLSLISQGKYDKKLVNKYDNNYYFPVSAGKDIDIIVIDSGFRFNYSEFKNGNRTVKCAGYLNEGKFVKSKSCAPIIYDHGTQVADIAAGAVHGVASSANVYGVALSSKYYYLNDGDIIASFQYVYENMIRANKTVINASFDEVAYPKDKLFQQVDKLTKAINNKGGIVVAAATNFGLELDVKKNGYYSIPCSLEKVICVGSYDNSQKKDFTKVYKKFEDSSYGKEVEIYGPMFVNTAYLNEKKKVITEQQGGSSFSSAIVSGVVATIMSDNPNTQFKKDTMLKKLQKNAPTFVLNKKNVSMINNGKHIVYSEDKVYHGCGVSAGNTPCQKSN